MKCRMTVRCSPASILLYAVLLAVASVCVCTTSTVYVRPEYHHTHCPGKPCHLLSYYEQRFSQYFVSNTIMVFMNGTHYLKAFQPLVIKDVENFTMVGSGGFTIGLKDVLEARSKIECIGTHLSGFNFINVTGIIIENITFTYCGQEVIPKVRAALAFDVAYNLILSRVTVRNSSGFGLHADGVFGSVWVYESSFLYNTGNKEYYGGNVRFWYGECPKNHSTYLQIESSYFLYGNDSYKEYRNYHPSATGLTLLIQCPAIAVSINNVTMVGNQADNGGNLAINFTDFTSNYHYDDKVPSVVINNSRITGGIGQRGGGLRVWSVIAAEIKDKISCNQTCKRCILQISNTQFVENHAYSIYGGGAMYIIHYEAVQTDYITRKISIENCTFSSNTVPPNGHGAVMVVTKFKVLEHASPVAPQFELVIQNCSFHNNSLVRDSNNPFAGATSIYIFSMEKIIFSDCNFTKNNSTALALVDSNLVLEGNILFDGNHAINGGALRFCDTSLVYIRNNTHIMFYNNHAKNAGGAIYAQQRCLEAVPPCFFQPVADVFTAHLKKWMSLTFVNNTAQYAGSGLYGGTVDYCYMYLHFKHPWSPTYSYSNITFNTIFDFKQQPGHSVISSYPYGVCLCNGSGYFNCSNKNYPYPRSIYPGEAFNISAVTVGQRQGLARAEIKGTVISSPNKCLLKQLEQNQNTSKRCVTLTYTLHSKNQQEMLQLTIQQSSLDAGSFYYNYPPPTITVLLRPCPWGFTLQHDPPYCDCDPLLVAHKMSCNINKQTIHREAPIWIGLCNMTLNGSCSFLTRMCATVKRKNHNTCQGVVIHPQCPYDYCILMNINITVNSTDEQCAFNRTGVLCGKCQNGLSLIIGSSKCLPCSNLYLLLLIVFALAGLALVIFLIVCNLTVSEGMINGIVYYANIVHINRSIFLPSTKANPLAVFIAWLNLDLGIETCFYDGMDAYAKAWLQFVFPIYIWLIAGLIILLSRRCTVAARLCGRNAVKVLATLFVLSVAKLERAIITALTYTLLKYPDGPDGPDGLHVSVWLPDANVKFLQGKHIPLLVTAVVFLALVLCFVLVLIFIPCLQKKSHTPLLFWVNKLKPLFDAYTGPYKDTYRFWPGLLLFLLSILFFLFALNDLGRPKTKLSLTAFSCFLVLALAWVFRGVYRKWPLDIIEASCILNVGLLAVVTTYILNDGNNQPTQIAVADVSVGILFISFIIVLIYQVYKQLTASVFWRRFVSSLSIQNSESQQFLDEPIVNHRDTPTPEPWPEQTGDMTDQLMPSVVHFDRYREPVLEFEDENA